MSTFLLSEVRIVGLFGELRHTIPLRDGGVTFIHGPNGCGKTTVLRLIAAVFGWDTSTLFEINFSTLELDNADGSTFYVEKQYREVEKADKPIASLVFGIRKNTELQFTLSRDATDVRIPLNEIEEILPFIVRVGAREWIDRNTGMRVEYQDLIERYIDKLPHFSRKKRPEWLVQYISRLNLHFIKTQRLLRVDYSAMRRHRPDEVSVADVIQIYSTEIKELISKKLAEQAAVSQLHDRSFPERLLSLTIDDSVSEDHIRQLYSETENKIQRLVEAGLIDKQKNIALPVKSLENTERRVLSLYLQDVNKKLSVFDELQKKIEAFLDVIGPKLRTKRFSVNRTDGFSIESTHRPGEMLTPSQLSSGEQHQIVLFYELIFKADSNSFFLVDEPEISLHVDWQRRFLGDIHKIATLGDRHFLIATHSPQIIGSHRELAIALDEGILDD
jgi:predicted ATP-binding protein involved in virulence